MTNLKVRESQIKKVVVLALTAYTNRFWLWNEPFYIQSIIWWVYVYFNCRLLFWHKWKIKEWWSSSDHVLWLNDQLPKKSTRFPCNQLMAQRYQTWSWQSEKALALTPQSNFLELIFEQKSTPSWSLFSKLYHWGHATIVHIAHNSTRRIERKKLHLLQRNDIGKMKRPLPDYGQKTVQKVLHHLYDMSKLQLIVTFCTQFVHTSKHIGAYVLIHKRLLYWYSFYSAHV